MLLAVGFTDELASGVVPAGSPELTASFHLSPSAAAGWTLFAFQLVGVVLEPPLLALSRGRRARGLRTLGLSLMAAALLTAAAAPTYAVLLAALALYGPASGLGTQLAQAALTAAAPQGSEAVLARFTLLSLAGDLLAPAVLAAAVALGLGWRGALLAVGLVTALQAAAAARVPAADAPASEEEAPLRAALRSALTSPGLLGWTLATALCGLMDEVLVSFGALRLAAQGMDATVRAVVLSAWVVGGMAGAFALERAAARVRPPALLLATGVGSAAAYAAWLAAGRPVASAALAALAGFFTAGHYPLLRARAFAARPGRPEVVLAVGSAFGALELAFPLAIGAVADRAGLLPAMLVLLLQPAGVVAAGLLASRRRGPGA